MNSYEAAQILGIDHDADADTVKKAYRSKSKEAHPDRGGSDEAFARIDEARRVMDAASKHRSDRTSNDGFSRARASTNQRAWSYTPPRNPGSSSRASAEDLSEAFRKMAEQARQAHEGTSKQSRRNAARFEMTDDHVAVRYRGQELLIQEPALVKLIDEFLERAQEKPAPRANWADGFSYRPPSASGGCAHCTGPNADMFRPVVCPVCGSRG